MSVDTHSVVCQSQDQVASEVDGEVVMMSIEKGNYYGLNPVGSRIWQLIETPVSVSALCDQLSEEFEVDRDTCQSEVLALLAELEAQSLIEIGAA